MLAGRGDHPGLVHVISAMEAAGGVLPDAHQHALGGLEIGQLRGDPARSASRRASRSPTFAFSALIWSNILGAVGMVAFSGFSQSR